MTVTPDDLDAFAESVRVVAAARRNYTRSESSQAALVAKYRLWHHWYAPSGGDQWPEDRADRPGKVHITNNIVKPFVDVDARLQAKLPRITCIPVAPTQTERDRAETAEKMMLEWLDASGWDWWLQRLTRAKGIYGKGVLKPFWNKEERRPDVLHIEQPHNLRIGWGASDFSTKDWALYEYTLSPEQVMEKWPDVVITDRNPGDAAAPLDVRIGDQPTSHDDPLGQKAPVIQSRQPTEYEQKHVKVWDYWYRHDGNICNAIILNQKACAKPPTVHREYVEIPYIVIENDHEPGSPEGMSNVEPLIDLNYELNRVDSLQVQLLVDNLDPAWQIDDDTVPDGIVPKGGEIIAAGEGKRITPIEKTVNTFPADQTHASLMNTAHRITGEGEILFGAPASAQDSGRALAVQVESVINRMDPKRTELYQGHKELLAFWSVMVTRLNPKFGEFRPATVLKGLTRWKIIGPEITPKDAADHTNNVINKLNAMLIDLRTAMDELGVDSPEDVVKMIAEDRSTLPLYPGNVQAMAQVGLLLLQLQQMGMSLEQIGQAAAGVAPAPRTGANNAQAQLQQAIPQGTEDQNQPATGAGGVPPLDSTTLVRSTAAGESQTLGQLAFNAPVGPTG